ncbi:hypothetical protein [Neptunicoccus cionae]|uniref:hypothetical protein n=1 Tax=Neptunicoccus cionae TaxID=2035344 RepID=UPI000C75D010|nr:hypothetical protein [Amylibacter cionae]PLS20923.1 hypothetical protein C0U40_15045 [Amylibacter cionae]
MAKLIKMNVFKAHSPNVETPLDKTTRIVRAIVEEEAEQRQAKNDRLRKARLKQEANLQPKPSR